MKSDYKFLFGGTKHSQATAQLSGIGGVLGIISWFVAVPAKYWIGGIGTLALAAALAAFLAATIAERKERESKRNRKPK
jgi:hypothetical protein